MCDASTLRRARRNFYLHAHPSRIDEVHGLPSALQLGSDLARHFPVVYRSAFVNEPWVTGPHRWCAERIERTTGLIPFTVAVTPNGRADAYDATSATFALPHEASLTMAQLRAALKQSESDPSTAVHYVQSQNNNLGQGGDFHTLLSAPCPPPASLSVAESVFGSTPDAVNVWVGDHRTVTTLHADPYENLYTVLEGSKRFALLAPVEGPLLPWRRCHPSRWRVQRCEGGGEEGGGERGSGSTGEGVRGGGACLGDVSAAPSGAVRGGGGGGGCGGDVAGGVIRGSDLVLDVEAEKGSRSVRWVMTDDVVEWAAAQPPHRRPRVYVVEVGVGDLLYLPAGWYHEVRNGAGSGVVTVAMNWWYDRKYYADYVVERLFRHVASDAVACDLDASSDSESTGLDGE